MLVFRSLPCVLSLASALDLDAVAAMSDQLALGALREAAGRHGAQSLREQGAACATAALGDPAPDYRDAWRLVRRVSTAADPVR